MKICFINNVYGEEIRGGAERIIKILSEYLKSQGHEVSIINCTERYKSFNSKSLWRRLFSHVFGFINIASYLNLRKKIKSGNFDLIWTHNLTGFGLISLLALGKAKKIHTCHDIQLLHPSGLLLYGQEQKLNTFIAKVYRSLVRLYFPKDVLVVFPSQWLANLHNQYSLFRTNKKLVIKNPLT